MDRPPPKLWRRWRDKRSDGATEAGFEALSITELDGVAGILLGVAIAALLAAVVFFLLPLIGIALELAALIALLGSGIVGRVLLRRPWTIEAIDLDRPERSVAFAVKGWRRSRRAIAELDEALRANGPPARLREGVPAAPSSRSAASQSTPS
jgi:hypothetical protein